MKAFVRSADAQGDRPSRCDPERGGFLRMLGMCAACACPAALIGGCGAESEGGRTDVTFPPVQNGVLTLLIDDFPALAKVGESIAGRLPAIRLRLPRIGLRNRRPRI